MKNVFAVLAIFSVLNLSAQDDKSNLAVTQNTVETFSKVNSNNFRSNGVVARFVNPPRPIEGSVHLWDSWKNTAVIYTTDNQKFLLKNINLNIKRNTFESQVEDDQVFTFNFNNIEKFVVNNKVYKNYYWDDDNKVYQVIYEDENFQLLKGYNLTFVEGSANPMLGRKFDRYVKKEHYYLRKDGKIKIFKLKKKKILKLVDGNEAKAKMIVEYANTNDLSFKSENDVQKILEYSAKN